MAEQITITPEQAQAAMDLAVAKENEVTNIYRRHCEAADGAWAVAGAAVDEAREKARADAKAIRDMDMAAAKKDTVRASRLVRKASVAASRAKAEAKAEAEAPKE